jgi:predicted nucleic acid-binding protein
VLDHAWSDIVSVSDRFDLTVYDAAYVDLALQHSLPLATLDEAMIKAAKRAGLAVLP